MSEAEANRIALETLDRINRALSDDANSLVSTDAGECNPSAAYIEVVKSIIKLTYV